jgi:dTDP-4-dehydrorhamnose reductase
MLGHKVFQVLHRDYPEIVGTMRGQLGNPRYAPIEVLKGASIIQNFDGRDLDGVGKLLSDYRPDVVVNCIGAIKQRAEAADAVTSIQLNSVLPHAVTRTLAPWGGRLIHFSTDCVFSGNRGNYTEDDPSDAEDIYGKSKYLGEALSGNSLVLRTSIIGRELVYQDSLLEWFLSRNHGTAKGFTRAWWSGVTTIHLSGLVSDIIRTKPELAGLYQVSSGRISKYDLLCLLRDAYALDVDITPDAELFCDRSLTGDRLREAMGYVSPAWPELIQELVNDPTEYDRQH